jgi:DNA-binding MarR family transcriptional regulator
VAKLSSARAVRASDSSANAPADSAEVPLRAIAGTGAGEDQAPLALDRLIHERVRLAIVSTLAVHDMLTFNELKGLLEITDGNLSVHARKLEDARYVQCKKGFDGRIPRTEFRLTAAGRRALEKYLAHMEALIKRVSDSG